jgi:flagellar FliL protein
MKKMIMMAVAALLLVGVSVGASLFFTGALSKEPDSAAAGPVEEAPLPEEILYHNVQPEFVVNFPGKSRVKFLMIEMSVATRDEEVLTVLSDHDPELRNSLLLLLSEQDSEALKTVEGKQALQKSAIERIEEVVGKYYRNDRVLDVLITRLVMQ